jgi:hypothetical protein
MFGISLLLGPIAFQDFEIPASISFGGAQRLTVHRLPGGGRVIDALGRDDADITWSGTLSGAAAAARAHELDELRVAGLPLPLTWDDFFYTAIIARFDAEYRSPYWIPYRITCTVLRDEASALLGAATSLLVAGTQDLAAAAGFGTDMGAAQTALAAPGATTLGTASYGAAVGAVGGAGSQIAASISTAQAGLTVPATAADFPATVAAAGQVAQLTVAQGYVARAATNLANADT